jgi:hypothetical protein
VLGDVIKDIADGRAQASQSILLERRLWSMGVCCSLAIRERSFKWEAHLSYSSWSSILSPSCLQESNALLPSKDKLILPSTYLR